MQKKIYQELERNGVTFPVTIRMYKPDGVYGIPETVTLGEAFVFVNGEKVGLRIGINATKNVLSPVVIHKLDSSDSGYRYFLGALFESVEAVINRWEHKRRIEPTILGRQQIRDTVEDDVEYVYWQLKRIKATGDVEDGSEILFHTEQGQQLFNEAPFISDRLKKEIHNAKEYTINEGLTPIAPVEPSLLGKEGEVWLARKKKEMKENG